MRIENIQMIARARQNHTAIWVANNMDSVPTGSAKAAYYEQMDRYQNEFTLADAEERFSVARLS